MAKKVKKSKVNTFRKPLPKFLRFFVTNWPIFALSLISILLCFLNFDSGTFLTGWDNLHPEFNPQLNLQRAFFSVWQEYQSTGLLGGMAHAADLPRVIVIYLLSLTGTVPLNYYRYFSTFIPLVLGPIGVYFLLHQIAFKKDLDVKTSEIASFLGSLFYLLNLGTLQNFFTPFESFTFFYGSLPWLLFLIFKHHEKPKTRTILFLFLISLSTTTSFYVETIFISFLFCIISIILDLLLTSPHPLKSTFKLFPSILTIIISNLFWLLPVVFFVITNGHVGEFSKINRVASSETYYRNLEFGNFPDLIRLKGFWFQFLDLGLNNKFDLLLSPWVNHLNSPLIKAVGLLFPIFFLIGLYYSFKKKFPLHKTFTFILGITCFFLLGGGLLINNALPFVGELFRSPFTKFVVPFTLSYSYFFAIGVIFLLDIFAFLDTKLTYNLTLFSVIIALLIYMSPAFSGNFISKNMRVAIPNQYFELFEYLNTQPKEARIANFPQHTFWGWNYYDWGYRGSGFLWYGIKQPILDRAFDVWDKTSENYYEELSSALFSQNRVAFDKVIDKYQVAYLLVDKTVIAPDTKADLGLNYLDTILKDNSQYSLEKTFGDNLLLYKNNNFKTENFLSLNQPSTTPTPVLNFDLRPNQSWYQKGGFLNTNTTINQRTKLHIPSFSDSENLLPYKVEYRKSPTSLFVRFTPITPTFFVNKKQIDLDIKPQTVQIPIGALTKKFIVNINSQYFPFELPSELDDFQNYYPITESYLPTNKSFDFSLYYGVPAEQLPLINSLANAKPVQCYTNKADRQIEKILSPRSVTLLGTDLVACLSTKIPKSTNPDQLLSVSFTYYSPTLTTANVNITDENFGASNTSQPLDPSNTPKRAQLFTKPSNQNKQINLILEASETKSIQEVTYKDVYLSTHDPIFEASVTLNKIPEKNIDLTEDQNLLQISLPNTLTQFDIAQVSTNNALFPEDRNCDQFNKGKTVKQINENYILYQSQDAIQCDFLNLRHFNHSLNYLIGLDVQNDKGLNLTTCLENHTTKRCDVYERLSDLGSTQYLLQPVSNPQESTGYTLHLLNQSLGSRITTNRLKSLTVKPFPLTFLKNITISSKDDKKEVKEVSSSIITTHPSEFLYTVKTICSGNCPASNLNLYQTESPFWTAYLVSPEDLSLNSWQLTWKIIKNNSTLSSLIAINDQNWHNRWTLPEDYGDMYLAIVYLPQYLEFLGFALLVLFTIGLLIFSLHKQLSPKNKS